MKKIIFVLVLLMSGLVKSQDDVYVMGDDSISWTLQSGKGEKILNQYDLESGISDMTHNMIDSIKLFVNDSLIDFYIMTNEQLYTKLNTEVIYEKHITQEELDLFIGFNPYAQFIFDNLLLNFKNSGIILDKGERYIVIYQLEFHYQPGDLLSIDVEPISTHIVLKIRRVLN